jgi:hypothetical protein
MFVSANTGLYVVILNALPGIDEMQKKNLYERRVKSEGQILQVFFVVAVKINTQLLSQTIKVSSTELTVYSSTINTCIYVLEYKRTWVLGITVA